jgi:hypothetical protein
MCCQVPHIVLCAIRVPQGVLICHRWHMAARKPDSEVGSLGVWAYDTARFLSLSPAQVAARAGVKEPTIRKVEGGSNKTPSRRLIYEMYQYFKEVGEQQGLPVEPPPGYLGELAPPTNQDALVDAIDRQTAMLKAVLDAILVRLPPAGPKEEDPPQQPDSTALDRFVPEVTQQALRALPDVERLAAQPPKRNNPSPRKRGPGGPGAGKRPRSQPDAPRG